MEIECHIEGHEGQTRTGVEPRKRDRGEERAREGRRQGHNGTKTMMLTEFRPSPACQPSRPVSSVRHCRGDRPISALWFTLVPPTLSPPLCITPTSPQKCDALQCCTLRRLQASSCSFLSQTRARRQELLHHPALTGGKTAQRCSAAAQGDRRGDYGHIMDK